VADVPAEGSGCTPGSGALPDGTWFAFVDRATASELVFDLACWFTGDAAVRAAAQDGHPSPPENDYYVRNDSTRLRTVTARGDTTVAWYRQYGDPTTEVVTGYAEWLAARPEAPPFGVWLDVSGGTVSRIAEQWTP
jgi:hypothetical protein